MLSFFDFIKQSNGHLHEWLVLGKGPSFERHKTFDISQFKLMSLNHVVQKIQVDVAHIIDLDVVKDCEEAIYRNAKYLVMPWFPHVKNKPGKSSLEHLILSDSFLGKLDQEGRLLYYNHVKKHMHGMSPYVEVKFFSAEGAINILAMSGTKKIRTLGIDGGNTYANTFSDLNDKTLLSNGRETFNKQFDQMAKIILKTGVDLAPLDVESPINIYVAATEAQMLSVKVLEYSIRKHASMSVNVLPLHLSGVEIPFPKNKENWPRTPFSFQRFLIPALQNYKGRAIYLDSDMQVFKDIRLLWAQDMKGIPVITAKHFEKNNRIPQFSVMLLNCEELNWKIEEIIDWLNDGTLDYKKLMYEMSIANTMFAGLDASWNSLERYEAGTTALIHYTDMNTQPWISTKNPLGYLWFRDLFEAIDRGFITLEFIKSHVEQGFIRPSLLFQVEHKIEDSILLPKYALELDKFFIAPYQSLPSAGKNKKVHFKAACRAYLRQVLKNHYLTRIKSKVINYLDKN